jgi:hypothetical protein
MDAKENTFQEHFLNGLPAWEQASVQFDKCTAASNNKSMVARNTGAHLIAHKGTVLGLGAWRHWGCTVVDS